VKGENDKTATVKENMFLFKFVAISNKALGLGKGSRSVQGTRRPPRAWNARKKYQIKNVKVFGL